MSPFFPHCLLHSHPHKPSLPRTLSVPLGYAETHVSSLLVWKWRENNSNNNTNTLEIAPEMNASNITVLVDLVKKGFMRK